MIRFVVLAFGVILLSGCGSGSAPVVSVPPEVSQPLAERAARAARPFDLEQESCSFVVAVNKSSNIDNGRAGGLTREALRSLMNSALIDGEELRVIPFQLDPDPPGSFTFAASRRSELWEQIDLLCSSSGHPAGGSDVEQAKHQVLDTISGLSGNVVGLVFTNHDRSQFPITPPPGWQGLWLDRALAAGVEERAREMGVEWGKYRLGGSAGGAWLYVVARSHPEPQPLGRPRPQVVAAQNQRFRTVAPRQTSAPPGETAGSKPAAQRPENPFPIVLLVLALILPVWAFFRRVPVSVDGGKARILSWHNPHLYLVPPGELQDARTEIELRVAPFDSELGALARISRGLFGAVIRVEGPNRLVELSDRRELKLRLPAGDHPVRVFNTESEAEIASFSVQVGHRSSPNSETGGS